MLSFLVHLSYKPLYNSVNWCQVGGRHKDTCQHTLPSRFQRHYSATNSLAILCALQMYFRLDLD